MWGQISAPMVTARALQYKPRMTIHNTPIVTHAPTSSSACIGLESSKDVRPRGILLCKELPIMFSRRDQKRWLDDWFNYAGFPAAMADFSIKV